MIESEEHVGGCCDSGKRFLNKQLCRRCEHGHEHLEVVICVKFAFKHSESPVGRDVNQEELILNECPYKLEHLVLTRDEDLNVE